ncbi:MAG: hypothetical protein A4S09_03935 [Proteobacteria bacterium SG_bin7]|nr:MAG: hypothetical protein A4S09_03935 [Proteobacteria bacterium SG_bin7]
MTNSKIQIAIIFLILIFESLSHGQVFNRPVSRTPVPTINDEHDDPDALDLDEGTGPAVDPRTSEFSELVQMGQPQFRGDGCDNNSARGTLSPDKTTLSIIFDKYSAEAGGVLKKGSKMCNIRIPFDVPDGFRVAVIKIDYRGFSSAPENGKNKLLATYQFFDKRTRAPLHTPVKRKKWFSSQDTDFTLYSMLTDHPFWTECGQDFDLYLGTRLVALTNDRMELSQITLDTVDTTQAQVGYHLLWRKCR